MTQEHPATNATEPAPDPGAHADRANRAQADLAELVACLEEEYGPLTEDERDQARAELAGIDAAHARVQGESARHRG